MKKLTNTLKRNSLLVLVAITMIMLSACADTQGQVETPGGKPIVIIEFSSPPVIEDVVISNFNSEPVIKQTDKGIMLVLPRETTKSEKSAK